jgi:4-diphosphocytidyl-2-C-methyl-D-erythritol kinase
VEDGMTNDNGFADEVRVAAPAKVNLALLVGPTRPDGFHEIVSLMLPVTLADLVTVRRTPGEDLRVECAVCAGESNLAARMVRELERRLERRFEVAVEVRKAIPEGAGLAGGSSDAAATMLALERLFELDLSPRLRYEVAAAVGSDVPFFLWPGPQLAMGRGQLLKDVSLPAPLHLLVAVPETGLSTTTVYGWRDEDARPTLVDLAPRARMLSSRVATARTLHDVAALVENDLEASVVARRPEVGALRDRVRAAGAVAAAMTGSGAAVFGLFTDDEAASRARSRLLAGDEAPAAESAAGPGPGSDAVEAPAAPPLSPGRVFCVTDLQLPPEDGRGGPGAAGPGPKADPGHEGARTPGAQSARHGRAPAPPRRGGPGRRRPLGR